MALNFRRFLEGIGLVAKTSATADSLGEMEVLSSTTKVQFHNGTTASPMVTESHASQGANRLKNKDLEDSSIAIVDASDTTKKILFDAAGTTGTSTTLLGSQTTDKILTLPDATDTLTGKATTDVLTNKSLSDTTSKVVNAADNSKILKVDLSGATANKTTTIVSSQTDNRSLTLPDATTTLVGTDTSQALTNKSLTISDSDLIIQDNTTPSKQLKFEASGITAATTRTLTAPDADTTIVGTDATQVITNKDIDGGTAANTRRITLPKDSLANIQALTRKEGNVWYASDVDKIYTDDGSSLFQVGSGSGSINYILNSDAETSTAGWAAYADAAGSSPVDGTGGSPTETITRVTSTPLRGTGMFRLTKDAANRQGEGVSYDFTIANADQAKPLQISFEYQPSANFVAGSDTTVGDIVVYIYDVTNATLIQPTPYKLTGGSSNPNKFSAQFQSASNSTSYRFILHTASTSALAYTLDFDDVSVGPQVQLYGYAGDDPVLDAGFGPSSAFGTVSGQSIWRQRRGSMMKIWGFFTTGTVTVDTAGISLPAGYTWDTTKITSSTQKQCFGRWYRIVPGASQNFNDSGPSPSGTFVLNTGFTTIFYPVVASASNVATLVGGTTILQTSDSFVFEIELPITGWSSNVIMSSDTDTRVVSAKYSSSLAGSIGNGVFSLITYETKVFDTHGAYNAGTGIFTVPVSGIYRVGGIFRTNAFSGADGRQIKLSCFKNAVENGTFAYTSTQDAGGATKKGTQGSYLVSCVAGDTLDVRGYSDDGPITLDATFPLLNFITFERLTGPSAIAASETVAMRYTTTAGAVLTKSTFNDITFGTKDYDTHGAFDGVTFTAPSAGKYHVCAAAMQASGASWVAGDVYQFRILKNGLDHSYTSSMQQATHTTNVANLIAADMNLLAGDTVKLQIDPHKASAGNSSMQTNAGFNYFCIHRIGL